MRKPKDDKSGKVKVVCRFRPLNAFEVAQGGSLDIKIENNEHVRLSKPNNPGDLQHIFSFDHVFDVDARQKEVYRVAAKPVVESVFDGFNGTIIAYGQTASGKTYTMEGNSRSESKTRGIIPRMVGDVFSFIDESPDHVEFMVKLSVVEIYMEKLTDLLDPKRKKNMKIRSDQNKGIYVEKLTEVYVSSSEEVFNFLKIGEKNRHVGRTNMNLASSRSHLVVSLTLHQNDTKNQIAKIGKLLMVDLAGSEKVSKTGAEGKTFEEAKQINQSLLYLGNVINALNEGKHVPYRNSQLTRLLENSLGGNSKTTLIINCSPADYNEQETLSTLRFGTRAQNVLNKPTQNCEYTLEQLQKMVGKLQEKNKTLINIVSYLKGVISTNLPNYELKSSATNQKNQKDKYNNNKAYSIAINNSGSNEGNETKRKTGGKNQNNRFSEYSDLERLQREIMVCKQKSDQLKFENIRLQKVHQTSSSENKATESSIVFSSQTDRTGRELYDSDIIASKKVTDYSGGNKSDRVIKDLLELDSFDEHLTTAFTMKLKSFELSSEVQRSLRGMFKKLEERNIILKSKMADMKILMSDMMSNFKDLVSKDYDDIQQLHKEILVKSIEEDVKKSGKNNKEVVDLLSAYHSENANLKKDINILKEKMGEKERQWDKQKSSYKRTLEEHDQKMNRLQKILRKFINGPDSKSIGTNQDVEGVLGQSKNEELLDWDKFSKKLQMESKRTKQKLEEISLEIKSKTSKIVSPLKGNVVKKMRGGTVQNLDLLQYQKGAENQPRVIQEKLVMNQKQTSIYSLQQ